MRVYIAAPLELRRRAQDTALSLKAAGHEVTSRWHRSRLDEASIATYCLADIQRAETLLLLNPKTWSEKGTGGRHTEFGYALAEGKRLVVLGVASNDFHRMPQVRVIRRVSDFS